MAKNSAPDKPTKKELANPPTHPIRWVVRVGGVPEGYICNVGPYKSAFEARAAVAVQQQLCPSILRCEPQPEEA